MEFNGIKVRRNTKLGVRPSDPTIDFDLDGNRVSSIYSSFVKIRECDYLDNGNYRIGKDAPSIRINHGGTWYGYGENKVRNSKRGVWVDGVLLHRYIQCTVYYINGGMVYTGSIRKRLNKKQRRNEKIDILLEDLKE